MQFKGTQLADHQFDILEWQQADFPHEDVELFDPNELFDLNEDTDPDTGLNF